MSTDVAQRFASLPADQKLPRGEYNFRQFRTKHLLWDLRLTIQGHSVQPGTLAPDFTLPQAGGGEFTLSQHRGRPVLLHFGSYT